MTKGENRFQDLLQRLSSKRPEEKLLAIKALGVLRLPEHAEPLKDLLGAADPLVIRETLAALGAIRHPGSVKYILEFLHSADAAHVQAAISALRQYKPDIFFDQVLGMAGAACPPPVRRWLLSLLSGQNDPRVAALMKEILRQAAAKELLLEALQFAVRFPASLDRELLVNYAGSGEWELSLTANAALARRKEETAYAVLKRLLKSPAHPIRLALAKTLNLHPVIEDRDLYLALFQDTHSAVRREALNGMSLYAAEERVRILRNWLTREKDPEVLKLLWRQAVHEANSQLYPQFCALLGSSDPAMKELAQEGLVGLGSQIVERMLADFERQSLVVREQMLLVFGEIADERAYKLIFSCLNSQERWIRINAIEAIASMRETCDIEHLRSMLARSDTDVWVRAKLVSVLGRLRDLQAQPLLVQQLKHSDTRVRANAVEALAELGDAQQVSLLEPFLRDPNDRVRVNAAMGLWALGRQEVIRELAEMAKESSKWVRSSAAFAFGEIGHKIASPILVKLLQDKEDIVVRNALEALAKIGDLRSLLPMLLIGQSKRIPEAVFQQLFVQYVGKLRQ